MVGRASSYLAVVGSFALLLSLPALAGGLPFAAEAGGVTFEVAGTPAAAATLAACQQVAEDLAHRGWQPRPLRVEIQAGRFDATSAADLVLDSGAEPVDNAFELVRAMVAAALPRTAPPALVRLVAETVAAHSVPAGTPARTVWEAAWLRRLAEGDAATTALPELLWRSGADDAVRRVLDGGWPEAAFATLSRLGVADARSALGEVVIAGLLRPAALGFTAAAPVLGRPAPGDDRRLDLSPGLLSLRIAPVDVSSHAVAARAARVAGGAVWALVRYTQDGGFDAVPLADGSEAVLPSGGVVWAGVAALGFEAGSRAIVDLLPREDFPILLERWDFQASEGAVVLTWETGRHEDLQGFVVETLVAGEGSGVTVRARSLVPVSDAESEGQSYTFVDEVARDVVGYRLVAVTGEGFLAEVGAFPLASLGGD